MSEIWHKLFIKHPLDVNETYFTHMLQAWKFSFIMIFSGFVGLIHSIIPGCFPLFISRIITRLYNAMVLNREKNGSA